MSNQIKIFLFGLLNFSLLSYALYRLIGPSMNQFFYARRATIRKQMLSQVMNLRKARAAAAQSRADYDALPKEMAARRAAILSQCREECDSIAEEAKRRAEYMLESAGRQVAEERSRSEKKIRAKLLVRAFEAAEDALREQAASRPMQEYAQSGLKDLADYAAGREGGQR
jgi:F0F1-type ATP synthase membrane subunit b/b'